MINVRELRLWTAALVAGLAATSLSLALPTLRFAVAARSANASNAPARLRDALDAAPVAPLARRLALVLAAPRAPAERAAALQELLALTPLASGAWLDLAMARHDAGAPMQSVASALAMSSLTGPNEARFMAGRAAFGLPLWDRLPPDVRRGLIVDLVSGWDEVGEEQRRELDADLTLAPDGARAEILAALLLAGKPAAPILKALDLAPEAVAAPAPSSAALPMGQGATGQGATGQGAAGPGAAP